MNDGHTIRHHWGQEVFWHKNVACSEPGADRVCVKVGFGMRPHAFEFSVPDENSERQTLKWAIENAFEAGQRYAKAEIRAVLEIKEPRP